MVILFVYICQVYTSSFQQLTSAFISVQWCTYVLVCVHAYRVFENIGTALGLMGCIRKLKIGRRLVELHEGQDVMVERVVGVRECGENPCSSLPCLHGATCHAIDSDKFRCACTQEFTGQNDVLMHHHSVTE